MEAQTQYGLALFSCGFLIFLCFKCSYCESITYIGCKCVEGIVKYGSWRILEILNTLDKMSTPSKVFCYDVSKNSISVKHKKSRFSFKYVKN